MGIAKRSTAQVGTSASIFDDLRIIRSRGGFFRVRPADLRGALGLPNYASLQANAAFDSALADLKRFLRLNLDEIASSSGSDQSLPARSLLVLFFNDGTPLDFGITRDTVGRTFNRSSDDIRKREDNLLLELAKRFHEEVQRPVQIVAESDPIAPIIETLISVGKRARMLTAGLDGDPRRALPNEPTEAFKFATTDLVAELKVFTLRRGVLASAQPKMPNVMLPVMILYQLDHMILPHQNHRNLLPEDMRKRDFNVSLLNDEDIAIDAQAAWREVTRSFRGMIRPEECYSRTLPYHAAFVATVISILPDDSKFAETGRAIEAVIGIDESRSMTR
jgi:hypothetical protein